MYPSLNLDDPEEREYLLLSYRLAQRAGVDS